MKTAASRLRIIELLERIASALEHTAPSTAPLHLSNKGSARRMRKHRSIHGQWRDQGNVTRVTQSDVFHSVKGVTLSDASRSAVAVPSDLETTTTERTAPSTDFALDLRKLYCHADQACIRATGKAPERRGPLERRKARQLLVRAGLDEAKAAVDRFARHWRDEPQLHDQARASRAGAKPWRFSFQHVLLTFGRWPCGCSRLRERKDGLRYVPQHEDRHCPRSHPRRGTVIPMPAPVMRKMDAVAELQRVQQKLGIKLKF